MKRAAVILTVVALLAAGAFAGPPNTKQIPNSSTWAVHCNVAEVHVSSLAEGMLKLITAEDSPIPGKGAQKAAAGWEKLGDVKSLTLFGPGPDPTQAVAIAELKYDQAEVMKMLGIVQDAGAVRKHGDHEIHSFAVQNPKTDQGETRMICFYSDSVLVGGANLDRIQAALDVLDGEGEALSANNPLTEMLEVNQGSFAVAAAVGIDKMIAAIKEKVGAKKMRQAAVLAKAESLRLEVGEAKGKVFGLVHATMARQEDAKDVHMAAQGFMALMRLREDLDPDVAELLDGITIQADGKTVVVEVQYPVAKALEKAEKNLKRVVKAAGGPEEIMKRFAPKPKPAEK